MKKTFIWLMVALVLIFLFIQKDHVFAMFKQSEPAMSFPDKLSDNGCLGLNYHRVLKANMMNKSARFLLNSDELVKYSVLDTEFQEQMDFLIDEGANFLTEDELLQAKKIGAFPEKCVWISFDDIDYSVYKNAFPILKESEIPFTMFLIAKHVGDENFSNLKMATWDEIREMQESGLASFGSHTYSMHRFEDETPIFLLPEHEEDFKKDLQMSIQTIENELNIKVRSFAYPYGNTNDLTTEILEKSGLEAGYILAPQVIRLSDYNYSLNRIVINHTTFQENVVPYIQGK